MKTAFLFPGQGAQAPGMGKDIARAFAAAAKLYRKANDIVGFDLAGLCFEGPAEQLNTTTISQPAIFVTSAAILEVFKTSSATGDLKPDVTAGLSLGEYTALYAAGAIDFERALNLVKKRGQAMQAAADENDGAMLGIIGLKEHQVHKLCAEAAQGELLSPVNFNCPGQIVISGTVAACKRAEELAGEYGAIKAVALEVAGAFHTEMMATAAKAVRRALANCQIAGPGVIRTIANITAEYYESAEEIVDGLARQLTQSILWHRCMERLIADGVEQFYEIGPGRVLTGLMRRINKEKKVVNVSSLDSISKLLD
jgi:[acyl-carrier-protein] S-malonyltransferase